MMPIETEEQIKKKWADKREREFKIAGNVNADPKSPHYRGFDNAIRPLLGACLQWEMDLNGGITQTDLARKSGVSKGVINNIIKGRSTHPSVWTMARLAKALRCSIDSLVSRKAQYIGETSQQEQKILDVYRTGSQKLKGMLDLVVEWHDEDTPQKNGDNNV